MYHCENCDKYFIEPSSREACMEDEFGVGSMFDSRNYGNQPTCPHCGSTDFVELGEDEMSDLLCYLYLSGKLGITEEELEGILNEER